jgi:acylphosphatase
MGHRAEVVFRGRVQGVGFRATAQSIAHGYKVTGWVRNEPDGSVKLIAEGEEPEVMAFIRAMEREMSGNIAAAQVTSGQATGEYQSFAIRR